MKKLILLFYISILTIPALSQEKTQTTGEQTDSTEVETEKVPFKNKLYFGGNLGMSFGSYTYIDLSPLVGIRWFPRFQTETGISYNYTKDKRYDKDYTYNQYGGMVNAQFYFIPQLFAHAEFQANSLEQYVAPDKKERHFVPFMYLGAGLRQNIGKNSFLYIRVLFDVINSEYSPYSPGDPYFSIGFNVAI